MAALRSAPRVALGGCLLALALLSMPWAEPATARLLVFGSRLTRPATLNTSANLRYQGTYTRVLPAPYAPDGIYHTNHWGVDTALWNATLPSWPARAPANGQALEIRLEGCAERVANGPRPLAQIHFQDLEPLPGGGARVRLTSQAFEIPVCGERGASGSRVSSYRPINLCVRRGDFVAFNDEGGYVPNVYRSGVPYRVLAAAPGARAISFLRGGGTNNGDVFRPADRSANDGFATNPGVELMMSVTLGSGADANRVCGGTRR